MSDEERHKRSDDEKRKKSGKKRKSGSGSPQKQVVYRSEKDRQYDVARRAYRAHRRLWGQARGKGRKLMDPLRPSFAAGKHWMELNRKRNRGPGRFSRSSAVESPNADQIRDPRLRRAHHSDNQEYNNSPAGPSHTPRRRSTPPVLKRLGPQKPSPGLSVLSRLANEADAKADEEYYKTVTMYPFGSEFVFVHGPSAVDIVSGATQNPTSDLAPLNSPESADQSRHTDCCNPPLKVTTTNAHKMFEKKIKENDPFSSQWPHVIVSTTEIPEGSRLAQLLSDIATNGYAQSKIHFISRRTPEFINDFPSIEKYSEKTAAVLYCDTQEATLKALKGAELSSGSPIVSFQFYCQPSKMKESKDGKKVHFYDDPNIKLMLKFLRLPVEQEEGEKLHRPKRAQVPSRFPVYLVIAPYNNGSPVIIYLPPVLLEVTLTHPYNATATVNTYTLIPELMRLFRDSHEVKTFSGQETGKCWMLLFGRTPYTYFWQIYPSLFNDYHLGQEACSTRVWKILAHNILCGEGRYPMSDRRLAHAPRSEDNWIEDSVTNILTNLSTPSDTVELWKDTRKASFWRNGIDWTNKSMVIKLVMIGSFAGHIHQWDARLNGETQFKKGHHYFMMKPEVLIEKRRVYKNCNVLRAQKEEKESRVDPADLHVSIVNQTAVPAAAPAAAATGPSSIPLTHRHVSGLRICQSFSKHDPFAFAEESPRNQQHKLQMNAEERAGKRKQGRSKEKSKKPKSDLEERRELVDSEEELMEEGELSDVEPSIILDYREDDKFSDDGTERASEQKSTASTHSFVTHSSPPSQEGGDQEGHGEESDHDDMGDNIAAQDTAAQDAAAAAAEKDEKAEEVQDESGDATQQQQELQVPKEPKEVNPKAIVNKAFLNKRVHKYLELDTPGTSGTPNSTRN